MIMSKAEAKLRLKLAITRASQLRNLLEYVLSIPKNEVVLTSSKAFITPHTIEVTNARWEKYCKASARQLYGINRKVSNTFFFISTT